MKSVNAFILLSFLLLTGCLHPRVEMSNFKKINTNKVDIVDVRPNSEKESEMLSGLMTSCTYGIARLGDKNVVPDRIEYLRNRISSEVASSLSNKKIVVKEFSIYRNNQVKLRGGFPIASGFVYDLLKAAECFAGRDREGGYDISENPTVENAAIVQISLSIDGKTIKARSVELAHGTPGRFPAAHDVWSSVIEVAIDDAINRIIEQI